MRSTLVVSINGEIASALDTMLLELVREYEDKRVGVNKEQLRIAQQILAKHGGSRTGGQLANAYLKEARQQTRPPNRSSLVARYLAEGIARDKEIRNGQPANTIKGKRV